MLCCVFCLPFTIFWCLNSWFVRCFFFLFGRQTYCFFYPTVCCWIRLDSTITILKVSHSHQRLMPNLLFHCGEPITFAGTCSSKTFILSFWLDVSCCMLSSWTLVRYISTKSATYKVRNAFQAPALIISQNRLMCLIYFGI